MRVEGLCNHMDPLFICNSPTAAGYNENAYCCNRQRHNERGKKGLWHQNTQEKNNILFHILSLLSLLQKTGS